MEDGRTNARLGTNASTTETKLLWMMIFLLFLESDNCVGRTNKHPIPRIEYLVGMATGVTTEAWTSRHADKKCSDNNHTTSRNGILETVLLVERNHDDNGLVCSSMSIPTRSEKRCRSAIRSVGSLWLCSVLVDVHRSCADAIRSFHASVMMRCHGEDRFMSHGTAMRHSLRQRGDEVALKWHSTVPAVCTAHAFISKRFDRRRMSQRHSSNLVSTRLLATTVTYKGWKPKRTPTNYLLKTHKNPKGDLARVVSLLNLLWRHTTDFPTTRHNKPVITH